MLTFSHVMFLVVGNASPVLVYYIAVHVKGVAKERARH